MFAPTLPEEVRGRGWDSLDVIIVSGDTYIDSPYNGSALVAHWLIDRGFRVGVICQPGLDSGEDILRLGVPNLFWSVSAGCVDSMVANYSSSGRRRKDDDFTPGGKAGRRPDRACIAYANLIRRYAKGRPIVLGGVEASLRRIAHYDAWTDSIRRSILFDAKADIVTYGMAELANLELGRRMREGEDWRDVRGICYVGRGIPEGHIAIPSYEECAEDPHRFSEAFRAFYRNCDPITARGIAQPHGPRMLIQNPPQRPLTAEELDSAHMSDYEYAVHPYYAKDGKVPAMDTIRNSITSHRGCYGECSFCAIAVHQGRTVVSRSEDFLVSEVERMASRPGFNGIIYDVGGPTANMYGIECPRKAEKGACPDRRCLHPRPCPSLGVDHSRQIRLLERLTDVPGVRRVFVASGIRYDMVVSDRAHGQEYIDRIAAEHTSGQLKIAPEHVSKDVLYLMGKPGPNVLLDFKDMFDAANERCGRNQFLTYYFIAAHPGCGNREMEEAARFCREELHARPEQVQVFTPTPSTVSTLMYRTGRDLQDERGVWSEHDPGMKRRQKEVMLPPSGRRGKRRERRPAQRSLEPCNRLRSRLSDRLSSLQKRSRRKLFEPAPPPKSEPEGRRTAYA